MAGLAEVSAQAGDRDGELLALLELIPAHRRAVAAGDRKAQRRLDDALERLQEVDPFPGRADSITARHREVYAELAREYMAEGWHNNALHAWRAFLDATVPGSPEHAEARAAVREVLAVGGDDVAEAGLGELEPRDAAWIEEHDKRTAKWSRAARFETPHYRIKTNAGWEIGSMAAAAMERVHAFYREIWGIVPDPAPERVPDGLRDISITPIDLNIYADHAEYVKRAGAVEWSGGQYTGSSVDTYDHGVRGTMSTLFHEASHQFMREAVGSVPSFVNEGVACLFEGIELLSNGSVRRDLPVMGRLDPLAKELKERYGGVLREVMGGTDAGKNDPEFYKYRWGVFYFLRMYVDEQGHYVYRDRLEDYIYDFKKGAPGDMVQHFTEWFVTGLPEAGVRTFDEFEDRWRKWILDLSSELRESDKRLDSYVESGEIALTRDDAEAAERFYGRALDIDAWHVEALWGMAEACRLLGRDDRATLHYRRYLMVAPRHHVRRGPAGQHLQDLDERTHRFAAASEVFAERMLELVHLYEDEGMPRSALRCAGILVERAPHHDQAREAVARLSEATGRSLHRWQRLYNGFDLDGWYSTDPEGSFEAVPGAEEPDEDGAWDRGHLVSSWSGGGAEPGAAIYRTLFLRRPVSGDWALRATLETDKDWQIVGLCFGARDSDDFDAIVLRNRERTIKNSVDYGTFDGGWTFRGDGSMRREFDPYRGVELLVEVKGREVFVTIDGTPLKPMVGGRERASMKYPLGALRGDIGLITSPGTTRFRDLELLAR